MTDYYKILGVDKKATKDDIKKAYKKLAKKYHPDLNKEEGATEKFKEISEAAAVLGDDQKRARYDQFGDADAYKQSGGQGFGGFEDFTGSFDFEDIFDRIFGGGGMGEAFGFGGGRRRKQRARGHDLLYHLEIELEEVASGVKKSITVPRNSACGDCNGTGADKGTAIESCSECSGSGYVRRTQRTPFGMVQTSGACRNCKGQGEAITKECHTCDGTGLNREKADIEVTVPKGAFEGLQLRLTGQGEAAQGGDTGDLYVQIHVKTHKHFERQDNDLFLELPITFATAALGGELEVPTLTGKAKLKIPHGTQTHTVFRMKDKGLPSLERGHGDQLVRVVVQIPKKLSKKQKELVKELGEDQKGFLEKLFS